MRIFDIFKKHKLGLYITDNYIQAAQLAGVPGKMNIRGVGQKELPPGLVQNGKIVNEKQLAQNINSLLNELKLKSKQCALAIPETQSYEHIFYIDSSLKGEEFIIHLEQLISEYIPIPFGEIQYNYRVTNYGEVKAVFVVAVNKNLLIKYYNLLDKYCGLKPAVFEPESMSLMRNLPLNFKKDSGAVLIDIQNNILRWYLIWGNYIFDSNFVAKGDTQGLVQSLNETNASFEQITKRKLLNIFVSGNKEEAESIIKSLHEEMKIDIRYIQNYKINLSESIKSADRYKVVSGLALHGLGAGRGQNINLVIK